jgi:uptake hydrogenase small subunit
MANLLWLQGGVCSGNTMSFLNAEEPSVCDLVTDFGIRVLWHPSLGLALGENLQKMLRALVAGEIPLDIFVFEGTVINAPDGSGEWNRFAGRPMKQWVADLANVAKFTIAIGDCATWGGIPATAPNPAESEGLQFLKRQQGGFLGKNYKSKAGLPVVNVPGCPAHPDWITQIIVAVATGRGGELSLDEFQRPKTFFTSFTQTGCTRNMHFAYKVSATAFGQRKRCLFYDLGCRGPMTHSPCNRILWNRQSSKTRAGMPCLGCTDRNSRFSISRPGPCSKRRP